MSTKIMNKLLSFLDKHVSDPLGILYNDNDVRLYVEDDFDKTSYYKRLVIQHFNFTIVAEIEDGKIDNIQAANRSPYILYSDKYMRMVSKTVDYLEEKMQKVKDYVSQD